MACIHELFEAQVELTPDAVAAVFEEDRLTYRELNRRADRLAQHLRSLSVGPDVLVALFLERSLDMVVGMLGVLKAGGAYVPLDPGHPRQRLADRLADAQPLVLLTQTRLRHELPSHGAQVVAIDADALPTAPAAAAADRTPGPRDLAYVIYTSGSTGEPKGVEIEHASVVNMLASMQRRPGLAAVDTMLAITTLSFDIAVLEIFLPLVCGARVIIAGRDVVGDSAALADLIARSNVNVMQATPATLRMLLDAGWQGDPRLRILCGGEAWTADLAGELLPCCASLWNMYGPTETTVWSAVARVEAGRPVAIGRPIANTRLYVLDATSQLAPVGVPGELFIGGDGLARGYWRRPELSQDRFVVDPYAPQPGARMYRTGDLVRRQSDGTLEFLGRLDHQVKLRGHRIELGEIEMALARQPGVERCVVVAREDTPGERRLVAYIIPADGSAVAAGELRRVLGETLPGYMLPAAFVSLAAFPLTPSGKLDRKALPAPDVSAPQADAALLEPRTPTEKVLARIFCEILGRERVGIRENFFDLGGHSLLALRVIGEINKALKVRLNVPPFFQDPTIGGLARLLEQKYHARGEPRVVPLQPGHTGLPLYFLGAGPNEYRLAQFMSDGRAIFGIDVPMPTEWHREIATGDRVALPTLGQLGSLYGDVLRAHAGSSPCVIAGYSLGGKAAFEAAHALQRVGGDVALILLLDSRVRSGLVRGVGWQSFLQIWRSATIEAASGTSYVTRLGAFLADSCRLLCWLLPRMPQVVRNRLSPATGISYYLENGGRMILSGFFDKEGKPIDQTVIDRSARIAGKSWRPRPLDALGVLIRTKSPGEDKLPGYDFGNGWRDLFVRGLEIVQTTGDHLSMFLDENIAALARQITEVLNRYETARSVGGIRHDAETEAAPATRLRGSDPGLSQAQQAMLHACRRI